MGNVWRCIYSMALMLDHLLTANFIGNRRNIAYIWLRFTYLHSGQEVKLNESITAGDWLIFNSHPFINPDQSSHDLN